MPSNRMTCIRGRVLFVRLYPKADGVPTIAARTSSGLPPSSFTYRSIFKRKFFSMLRFSTVGLPEIILLVSSLFVWSTCTCSSEIE